MLEMHADKGNSAWSIYAWCVHDAMCKYSSLPNFEYKCDLRDKFAFKALMNGSADCVEINGQLFSYKND